MTATAANRAANAAQVDYVLTDADERPHAALMAGAADRFWQESWYFDFAAEDGTLGGYVRLGYVPNLGTDSRGHRGAAWYWACLVGEDRPLVTVIDHHVPLPRPGSLEIRADGLWADHTIESPYDHVSLGCEAFAVQLDDPAEVYGAGDDPRDLRGQRVPFGLDLEWETDPAAHAGRAGGPYAYPGTTRYELPCRVHGEVLVGDERIDFDGIGQRDHSWAPRDWWQFGWVWTAGGLDDGTRFHSTRIRIPGLEAYAPGYVQPPGGPLEPIEVNSAEEDLGAHGLPTAGRIGCGPLALDVEPVAFSPVQLVDPGAGGNAGGGEATDDGEDSRRVGRFPRALCRFTAADGRTGVGWTEWNQPQPPVHH